MKLVISLQGVDIPNLLHKDLQPNSKIIKMPAGLKLRLPIL